MYNNSHLNLQGEDKYLEAISTTHGYHDGTPYIVAIISDAHLRVIDVVDLIKYYPLHISDHIRTIVQHGPEGNSQYIQLYVLYSPTNNPLHVNTLPFFNPQVPIQVGLTYWNVLWWASSISLVHVHKTVCELSIL